MKSAHDSWRSVQVAGAFTPRPATVSAAFTGLTERSSAFWKLAIKAYDGEASGAYKRRVVQLLLKLCLFQQYRQVGRLSFRLLRHDPVASNLLSELAAFATVSAWAEQMAAEMATFVDAGIKVLIHPETQPSMSALELIEQVLEGLQGPEATADSLMQERLRVGLNSILPKRKYAADYLPPKIPEGIVLPPDPEPLPPPFNPGTSKGVANVEAIEVVPVESGNDREA